jgi:probable F420-dependent oxidoreductase
MFDSVWTTDHIAVSKKYPEPYGNILESLVTLSYAAASTKRVKLGTSIIVLPMRDPMLFAKQVATLDVISDGRVILGLGAGWMEEEYITLGSDFKNRGKRLDEQIRLIKVLWTHEQPHFEGRFYKVTDALFSPRPIQENGPPIWIAGDSPAALRRVAEFGDTWHPVGLRPSEISQKRAELESILKGKRKVTTSVRLPVEISPRASSEYKLTSGETAYMLGGTRSAVIKETEALERAGVEYLVCYFGNRPYDFVSSQASLFANEIMACFNRKR